MRESEIRAVVEAVVRALAEKGMLKEGGSCGCKGEPSDPIRGNREDRRVLDGKRASPSAAPREVKVTMGSAGKVFGGDWSKPKTAPVADKEHEHTHTADCPHCQPSQVQGLGADRVAVCHPSKGCNAIARYVDHTLLKPNATQEEIAKLCTEARAFCFASVCINPSYVALAARLLGGSGVKVCTVVGFPLGSTTPTVKAIEARDAIANGADEIDMVINVGALKSGNDALVRDDIRAVREAARGKTLKVILETSLLTDAEKVRACKLAKEVGADFVKTSTGFSTGGATTEDIRLMRETVGPLMGVKASGGIRDTAAARAMISAGVSRLGTSASVAIVTDVKPAGGAPKAY